MFSPAVEASLPHRSPSVAAIVLAAGMSRRMGRPKMLLPFGGRPLLARVLEALFAGGAAECLVVTGHARQTIERILDGFPGAIAVHNDRHATGGMLSSVQTGVAALPTGYDAFFVALGDQPMVAPKTVQAIVAAWTVSRAPIVLPVHGGRRGHPLLFSAACARAIRELPEGATLRDAVSQYADQLDTIDVMDPAVLHDVDTPEDYARARRAWESLAASRHA